MAGANPKPPLWSRFVQGVVNLFKPTAAPVDENGQQNALLEAVNVVLDNLGRVRRRKGRTRVVQGVAHSLFPGDDYLFAVVDGEFRAYRKDVAGLSLASTIATVGDRFLSCATDDFDVYWSNGVMQGRVDENLALHPFWIDAPAAAFLSAYGAGGLARGRYEVCLTAVDARGRESGASPPALVDLSAGQGIAVTFPAAPTGLARWRVSVTAPNGEVFYQCAELPASATSYLITAHPAGAKLETLWLHTLIPCQQLRYAHNRLYGLINNLMVWSEPYRLGLMHPNNHMVLGNAATLLEPVGDGATAGCWVADHKRTYWLSGADPKAWQQIAKYPHPAVPGSSLLVPGSYFGLDTTEEVAYWLADKGEEGCTPCIGLPNGQLIPLREESLALAGNAERGATGLMFYDGIRQLLTTTYAATANHAAASDSAEATVRRRTP